VPVIRFTAAHWNDPEDRRDTPDVMTEKNRSTDRVRRVLRRLDDWTLTVFNPYLPSDRRSAQR
jgi:hypothetical protein